MGNHCHLSLSCSLQSHYLVSLRVKVLEVLLALPPLVLLTLTTRLWCKELRALYRQPLWRHHQNTTLFRNSWWLSTPTRCWPTTTNTCSTNINLMMAALWWLALYLVLLSWKAQRFLHLHLVRTLTELYDLPAPIVLPLHLVTLLPLVLTWPSSQSQSLCWLQTQSVDTSVRCALVLSLHLVIWLDITEFIPVKESMFVLGLHVMLDSLDKIIVCNTTRHTPTVKTRGQSWASRPSWIQSHSLEILILVVLPVVNLRVFNYFYGLLFNVWCLLSHRCFSLLLLHVYYRTVSYTHLDVYKRQLLPRLTISAISPSCARVYFHVDIGGSLRVANFSVIRIAGPLVLSLIHI